MTTALSKREKQPDQSEKDAKENSSALVHLISNRLITKKSRAPARSSDRIHDAIRNINTNSSFKLHLLFGQKQPARITLEAGAARKDQPGGEAASKNQPGG